MGGVGYELSVKGTLSVHTNVLISNRSLENLSYLDALMFSLLINNEISSQDFLNYYIAGHWDKDPSVILYYILAYAYENGVGGD